MRKIYIYFSRTESNLVELAQTDSNWRGLLVRAGLELTQTGSNWNSGSRGQTQTRSNWLEKKFLQEQPGIGERSVRKNYWCEMVRFTAKWCELVRIGSSHPVGFMGEKC